MAAGTGGEGLTPQWLLAACGATSLNQIKSVDLWAKGLTTAAAAATVGRCTALQVASLSMNSIDSLAAFKSNSQLAELFLRKNKVDNILDLGFLAVRTPRRGGRGAAFERTAAARTAPHRPSR